ncbi:MAG: hypothetical protein PHR35_00380 [Kiritimatiellae bacterium]|nr:hypothetical protein [Kiritimatiellia bacterium]
MNPIQLFLTSGAVTSATEEIVSVGVPFARGDVRFDTPLRVRRHQDAVVAQVRELGVWPDDTSRWGSVTFPVGPEDLKRGVVVLEPGEAKSAAQALVVTERKGSHIEIDTGVAIFRVSLQRGTLIDRAQIGGTDLIREGQGGFQLKDAEDRVFSSAADTSPEVELVERGPYRALVRQRALLRRQGVENAPLLVDARLVFFAGTARVEATVTYTASGDVPELFFRDLRWELPHPFEVDRTCDMRPRYVAGHMGPGESKAPADALPRFAVGCGFDDVFDDQIDPDSRYFLLQTAHDAFNLYQDEPGYGIYPVASSGARGDHAPGWVSLQGQRGAILWRMADFWASFPKEIEISQHSVAFAVWPERALPAFLALPHDPEPPDPRKRWREEGYECLMPFPSFTGASPSRGTFALVAGIGRTHTFSLEFTGGGASPEGRAWHAQRSAPPLAWVDPAQTDCAGVLGPLAPPASGTLQPFETMLDRAFAWDRRMQRLYRSYGELDYGDLQRHYQTVRLGKATKGRLRKREDGGFFSRCHPRAGWWNNNERDTHRGYYVQFMRTGRREQLDAFLSSAHHNMEVDFIRLSDGKTGPGLVAHQEGHHRKSGAGFDIDHNWCSGFFDLYHVTGDPRALEAARLIADHLARAAVQGYRLWGVAKETVHPRYLFRSAWELAAAYLETHDERYLEAARGSGEELLRRQNEDGRLARGDSYSEGGCQMALLRLYQATGEARYLAALKRAVRWSTADLEALEPPPDVEADSRPALLAFGACRVLVGDFVGLPKTAECLAHLIRIDPAGDWAERGRRVLDVALAAQDRTGRAVEDGNWNEEHRCMPYRTGNALQHLPLLLAALETEPVARLRRE